MRIYAITGALLTWFALVLQLYLVIVQSPPGLAMLRELITYFSFFTILTNLLVALVFTAIAVRPAAGWVQFFSSPSIQGGTAVYIAIVGIVIGAGYTTYKAAAEPKEFYSARDPNAQLWTVASTLSARAPAQNAPTAKFVFEF